MLILSLRVFSRLLAVLLEFFAMLQHVVLFVLVGMALGKVSLPEAHHGLVAGGQQFCWFLWASPSVTSPVFIGQELASQMPHINPTSRSGVCDKLPE